MRASLEQRIHEVVAATPWLDTHEHLVEERHRLGSGAYRFIIGENEATVAKDWTCLMTYAWDDLLSSGMPTDARAQVDRDDLSGPEKWGLVEPWFEHCRSTGYLQAVDLTSRALCGAPLSAATVADFDQALARLHAPGYYVHVLRDLAGVARSHVNSLDEDPFCETAQPGLLDQDLNVTTFLRGAHPRAERAAGIEVGDIDSLIEVLAWWFERVRGLAVAVKSYMAYDRRLMIGGADRPGERAFRGVRDGQATEADHQAVSDYILLRALDLAAEYDLPFKLHLGYLAGTGQPLLSAVFDHVRAAADLAARRPQNRFVLMHAAWPDSDRLVAVAKHFPNVWVDLCWAWILAPRATRRFVGDMLTSAPATKLLCFGGDYSAVESVIGHAQLARRGLVGALADVASGGGVPTDRLLAMVPRLMHDNAALVFGHPVLER